MNDEKWSGAQRARRLSAAAVLLIAASMLVARLAGLDGQTDNLTPMSPLTCLGFVAAAIGTWALPQRRAIAGGGGGLAALVGAAGLLDQALDGGRAINRALFDVDASISVFTAAALLMLGSGIVLDGRGGAVTRRLAFAAGAIGGAAVIGFLLAVPFFYGPSRAVHMSWQAALCTVLIAMGLLWTRPTGLFFADSLSGRFARRTVPAVLGIPIVSGALATAAVRAGWWESSIGAWVMTLTAVGGLAFVVAMAVKRLQEDDRRLTELAIRDPLTGAYNRRHFLTQAENAAARARRYGESAAIAVVDLDRFKQVNDELHVDPDEASAVADQMRAAVHEVGRELTAEGFPNRLGASVGIATVTADVDVEALVDLADQRMDDDKRLGRQEVERSTHH